MFSCRKTASFIHVTIHLVYQLGMSSLSSSSSLSSFSSSSLLALACVCRIHGVGICTVAITGVLHIQRGVGHTHVRHVAELCLVGLVGLVGLHPWHGHHPGHGGAAVSREITELTEARTAWCWCHYALLCSLPGTDHYCWSCHRRLLILNRLCSPRPSPLARPLIGWLGVTCSPIGQMCVNIVTLSQLISV